MADTRDENRRVARVVHRSADLEKVCDYIVRNERIAIGIVHTHWSGVEEKVSFILISRPKQSDDITRTTDVVTYQDSRGRTTEE